MNARKNKQAQASLEEQMNAILKFMEAARQVLANIPSVESLDREKIDNRSSSKHETEKYTTFIKKYNQMIAAASELPFEYNKHVLAHVQTVVKRINQTYIEHDSLTIEQPQEIRTETNQ